MHPTVDHIHHGHGQHVGVGPPDVAEQGKAELVGCCLGRGQRHPEDGVCPEPRLVGCPVGVDEGEVDPPLVEGVGSVQDVGDLSVDVGHRVGHTLAPVAVAPVPEFHRLEGAGRRTRRHDGPSDGPRVQHHLDLDGGVAAGIQDLSADDLFDEAHCAQSLLLLVGKKLPPATTGYQGIRAQ